MTGGGAWAGRPERPARRAQYIRNVTAARQRRRREHQHAGVVLHAWRRFLRNHRALYVRRLLVLEPGVTLTSVPCVSAMSCLSSSGFLRGASQERHSAARASCRMSKATGRPSGLEDRSSWPSAGDVAVIAPDRAPISYERPASVATRSRQAPGGTPVCDAAPWSVTGQPRNAPRS